MEDRFFTPSGESSAELKIKNSRFIGIAAPCLSAEHAKEIIKDLKEKNPSAAHVVYAFVLGPKGEVLGQSDDGEPKGTAGRPVLEILKGRRISNIILAVIRYFGGTKLGTGGLVRAYGETAKETLAGLKLEENREKRFFSLSYSYNLHETVKRTCSEYNAVIHSETFGEKVSLYFSIPIDEENSFRESLAFISGGKTEMVHVPSGEHKGS